MLRRVQQRATHRRLVLPDRRLRRYRRRQHPCPATGRPTLRTKPTTRSSRSTCAGRTSECSRRPTQRGQPRRNSESHYAKDRTQDSSGLETGYGFLEGNATAILAGTPIHQWAQTVNEEICQEFTLNSCGTKRTHELAEIMGLTHR